MSTTYASSMKKVLLALRYIVFALFIASNAIICSVAVWNRSIGQYLSASNISVDVYLIFLGAAGLVFVFPIILIDLAYRNHVTSRVWFECTWVGVFSVMELAGAAALAAILPYQMCSNTDFAIACTSTRVLVAFTWICTISLLIYLVALSTSALCHQKRDPKIWHCAVRYFPWNSFRQYLNSAPSTPILPQFSDQNALITSHSGGIAAPKPLRAAPAPFLNTTPIDRRSSLRPNYRIEMEFPSTDEEVITEVPVPPVPAASRSSRLTRDRESTNSVPRVPATALYPSYVQPTLMAQNPGSLLKSIPTGNDSKNTLGDWPRLDAVSRPMKERKVTSHRDGPISIPSHSNGTQLHSGPLSSAPPEPPRKASSTTGVAASPGWNGARRPSGPRTSSERARTGSYPKLPPLDLSKISNIR